MAGEEAYKDLPNGTIIAKDGVNLLDKQPSEEKSQQQPVAQAGAIDPNAGNAANQETDYKAKFKELYGVDTDELPSLREKATQADSWKAQLDADPYDGDTEISALAKLKKQGVPVQTALQYLSLDVEKLSPKEQKIMLMSLDKPGIAREKIIKAIDQEYKLGDFAPKKDDDETPDEQDGLDRLEIESAGSDGTAAKLAQKKEDLLKVAAKPRSQVAQEQTEQALKTDWEKSIPALKAKATAFEIQLKGMDKPIKVDLELSDEDVKGLIQNWSKSGYAPNDSTLPVAEKILREAALGRNVEKIVTKAVQAATGKLEEDILDDLHHPSVKLPAPTGQIPKSGMDELKEAADRHKAKRN